MIEPLGGFRPQDAYAESHHIGEVKPEPPPYTGNDSNLGDSSTGRHNLTSLGSHDEIEAHQQPEINRLQPAYIRPPQDHTGHPYEQMQVEEARPPFVAPMHVPKSGTPYVVGGAILGAPTGAAVAGWRVAILTDHAMPKVKNGVDELVEGYVDYKTLKWSLETGGAGGAVVGAILGKGVHLAHKGVARSVNATAKKAHDAREAAHNVRVNVSEWQRSRQAENARRQANLGGDDIV